MMVLTVLSSGLCCVRPTPSVVASWQPSFWAGVMLHFICSAVLVREAVVLRAAWPLISSVGTST